MFTHKRFAVVIFKAGTLDMHTAFKINEAYKSDKDYSEIHYLLTVLLDVAPTFSQSDLTSIADFYTDNLYTNNHKTSVWLVNKPMPTAFAHLFMQYTDEKSFYCSTVEKAFELLDMPDVSFKEFSDMLQEARELL